MRFHLHKYKFDSKCSNGHKHVLMSYTDSMIGFNKIHFHFFYGISSYNDHTHYYSGFTGLPVKTENGHIHKMEGYLECNSLHEHKFRSYTFEDVEYTGSTSYSRWAIGSK